MSKITTAWDKAPFNALDIAERLSMEPNQMPVYINYTYEGKGPYTLQVRAERAILFLNLFRDPLIPNGNATGLLADILLPHDITVTEIYWPDGWRPAGYYIGAQEETAELPEDPDEWKKTKVVTMSDTEPGYSITFYYCPDNQGKLCLEEARDGVIDRRYVSVGGFLGTVSRLIKEGEEPNPDTQYIESLRPREYPGQVVVIGSSIEPGYTLEFSFLPGDTDRIRIQERRGINPAVIVKYVNLHDFMTTVSGLVASTNRMDTKDMKEIITATGSTEEPGYSLAFHSFYSAPDIIRVYEERGGVKFGHDISNQDFMEAISRAIHRKEPRPDKWKNCIGYLESESDPNYHINFYTVDTAPTRLCVEETRGESVTVRYFDTSAIMEKISGFVNEGGLTP